MTQNQTFSTQDQNSSGSCSSGEPDFLVVGKLRRPHGVRGEILMSVWTDFPERLKPGVDVYVGDDHRPLSIRSVRWHRQDMLIAFDGCTDRDQAGEFRNQLVMVRDDDRPSLLEGEFYLHQLIGMRVIADENNAFLGNLVEIIETGANDVYIVHPEDGPDILLPDIDPVILDIDIEGGEIRVHLIPGLIPEG
ncbi:MAG: ribosome maturation factor RimM [Chloroflexi bacterium]|nr:ribosome maturation factor RimM [Chloroflexota bacterium]MBU1662419.1 ribosome maturation factor RimM [Chloroflexota bacterium]